MLEIHGGSDKSVIYNGGNGEGGTEPAIPTWLGWWAERNACTSSTVEDTFDGDVHHTTWACAGGEGVLQHWKIDDMGESIFPTYLDVLRGFTNEWVNT